MVNKEGGGSAPVMTTTVKPAQARTQAEKINQQVVWRAQSIVYGLDCCTAANGPFLTQMQGTGEGFEMGALCFASLLRLILHPHKSASG